MPFFGDQSVFGALLEPSLRHYWEHADQNVSYQAFRIRHAYWYASSYADVLSWKLEEQNLSDPEIRKNKEQSVNKIRDAARYISHHQHQI